jgi:tetratricopeptide (TPR) repeat protein
MIKNESRILQRSLLYSLPYVDGVCILDTGSTDNTVELAESIIETTKTDRPNFIGKVYHCPFKNFGFNRTKSFEYAVELLNDNSWDLADTYGLLLDADMILHIDSKERVINVLKKYDSMMIYQEDGNFKYYNIRFIKMCHKWDCSGVTHEYWRCVNEGPFTNNTAVLENDVIWIEDVSDGGCKSDKIERDIRMLTEALENDTDSENASRYQFYLAQSYLSSGNYKKSIEHYTKHIEMGSFTESIWFATFMIGRSLLLLDEPDKAEIVCRQAHSILPGRSEPLFDLAKYYWLKGPAFYDKVEEYVDKGIDIPFPQENLMYIESTVYNFGFKVLRFKLMLSKKEWSIRKLINYYNEIGKNAKSNKKDVSIDECVFAMSEKVVSESLFTPFGIETLIQNKRFIICRVKAHDYRILINNGDGSHSRYRTDSELFFDPLLESTSQENIIGMISNLENLYYAIKDGDDCKFYLCGESDDYIEQKPDIGLEMVKDTYFLKTFKSVRSVLEGDVYYALMELRSDSKKCVVFIVVLCDSKTGNVKEYTKPFYFETGVDEYCSSFFRYEYGNFAFFYRIGNTTKVSIVDVESMFV